MNNELLVQEQYWDKEAELFDSIYSGKKSAFGKWLDATFRKDMYERFTYTISHSEPIAGKTILDVGCGTGLYALEFAKRGAKQVVGLDIAETMVTICRQRARDARAQDICEFIKSDLMEYTPEHTFDVCIGIGLFDYIRDASPVLKKMREVVHDRAIFSFPRANTLRAYIRKIRLMLRGCPVYFYSRKQLDQQLHNAGFKRHETEILGQLFCITAYVD